MNKIDQSFFHCLVPQNRIGSIPNVLVKAKLRLSSLQYRKKNRWRRQMDTVPEEKQMEETDGAAPSVCSGDMNQ